MRQLALWLCLALCLSTPALQVLAQAAGTTAADATAAVVKAAAAADETNPVSTKQNAAAAAATDPKAKSGSALDAAVEEASEAQEYREEPADKVVAQVVKEEAAAELANGDADVSTTGSCSAAVDEFCLDILPGEGRLATCLSDQLREQQKADYTGSKLTDPCIKELDAFKKDTTTNINRDLPLAKACADDVTKLCKNLQPDESALGCLRRQKDKVSSQCSGEIFRKQTDAAEDFRLDKELYEACKVDAESLCKGTSEHGGAMQECLRSKRQLLSWDCQEQLFRQEMENSGDLRLSVRLFRACLADKKKFCADVPPGNARAKDCLEEHRNDAGFTEGCKTELEKMMEARAADFRLDFKLRKLCKQDIQDVCGYEADSLDSVAGYDARVITCLQDYKEDIKDGACLGRVNKIQELASSDIRFDVPLADACYEDRQTFCSSVQPGSARVIRCLQDRREDLSYECKATLFDQEVRMAESIDFQFPMKKACQSEITTFCKDVPHGHARVIRCLEENMDKDGFGTPCKDEVQKHQANAANDYRLNFRLTEACNEAMVEKCADVCSSLSIEEPCGGTVLRCLADNIDEIKDEKCKKEVFYFQKMEVKDFRNDVILAEACRPDVESYCAGVKPGEGRVHKCLREHRGQLSAACAKEELRIEIMESTSVELQPSLAKSCKKERAAHCADVRPGKARVFNCLLANSDEVDFTDTCQATLQAQEEKRLRDWRMDYDLRQQCKADVQQRCNQTRIDEDKETGSVLKCLVAEVNSLSQQCTRVVGTSIRNGLQFYQPKLPVIEVCDSDVMTFCLHNKGLDSFRVGEVKKCLINLGIPAAQSMPLPLGNSTENNAKPAATAADTAAADTVAADAATTAVAAATGTDKPNRRLLAELHRQLQQAAGTIPEQKLSPQCEALVVLAEPQDAYSAYQTSLSASAVSSQIKSLEKKLGVAPGTLTAQSGGGLSLTGWAAVLGLLAIVVVTIGGGVYGYRRYHGMDKQGYTLVYKTRRSQQSPTAAGV